MAQLNWAPSPQRMLNRRIYGRSLETITKEKAKLDNGDLFDLPHL